MKTIHVTEEAHKALSILKAKRSEKNFSELLVNLVNLVNLDNRWKQQKIEFKTNNQNGK